MKLGLENVVLVNEFTITMRGSNSEFKAFVYIKSHSWNSSAPYLISRNDKRGSAEQKMRDLEEQKSQPSSKIIP